MQEKKLSEHTLEKLAKIIVYNLEANHMVYTNFTAQERQRRIFNFLNQYRQIPQDFFNYEILPVTCDVLHDISESADEIKVLIEDVFDKRNFMQIGKEDQYEQIIDDFNKFLGYDGFKLLLKKNSVTLYQIPHHEIEQLEQYASPQFTAEINKIKKNADSLFELCNLDKQYNKNMAYMIDEIEKCVINKTYLAGIILCGSVLETILLTLAIVLENKQITEIIKTTTKDQKYKQIHDLSLSDLINYFGQLKIFDKHIKSAADSIRHLRNFIHANIQNQSNLDISDQNTVIQEVSHQLNSLDRVLMSLHKYYERKYNG